MFLFFNQKTAYEMRISDWSSDVCSSDLFAGVPPISNTLPGFTSKAWFGMFGPAGMSPERVKQLNAAVVEGAKHSTFIDLMTHGGGEVEIGRASCRESVCQYV